MLATLQKFLAFEMTIAEWIGTAVIAVIPYLVIGVLWSATHIDRLSGLTSIDGVATVLGSIVGWPVLLFSDVCTA